MNFLVDIGHPAHVHYYRNLAKILEQKGHRVFWTVKDLKIAQRLLNYYDFEFDTLPAKADSITGKVFLQLYYDLKVWQLCLKNKISIGIGTSVTIAHVSRISKLKSFVFDDDDDDVQPLVTKYVNPFADVLFSPDALIGKRGRTDTVFYPGYHELAYLHPKRFTPDQSVLSELGINPNETFFIMRFNTFKAHHDVGVTGLSLEQKLKLINILKPHGRIFITTERDIEPELKEHQLKVSPEKIHSLMAFCTMFLGDSQTMTSEAAVLGIPSLRCNTFAGRIAYLEEQENKYQLTFGFKPDKFDQLTGKLVELLKIPNLRQEWKRRQQIMLNDKIDVTAFWAWYIDNFAIGKPKIENTPEFWGKFK